jgi:transposase
MLGPSKPRRLAEPIAVSLETLVPRDNFYRHLEATLDLGFVREWTRGLYAERGRPSIDPVVFFKLYLVMFFEGIRSERQLLALAADRLGVRWYLGYGLDETLPDASGFTRIRQRLGLAVFRRFFERVVDLCQEAGLVWGKEVFADATRVPGNASTDSLVPRLSDVVDGHLVALFGDAAAPNGAEGTTQDGPGRWDLLEECRLDPARPSSGPYRRLSDRKVSRTDPDAAAMSMRDGRGVLGYQDHYLVDGGRARIVLHCPVTPGDVAENQVLLDQLRRALFRRKLRPERLVADAKVRDGRAHPRPGGAGDPRLPAVARVGHVLALLPHRRLRLRRRERRLPLPPRAGAQAGVDRRSRRAHGLPGACRQLQRLPGEG